MTLTTPATAHRWGGLLVLCLGFLMVQLDQTIVNVALPSIRSDLSISEAGLAWVTNAYLVGFGGVLLFVGRLGDLLGKRRMFVAGIVVFTVASLGCGFATNAGVLVAARFLQGLGGAMSSAVILAMIVTMFPDGRGRARALGVYSLVAAGGASLGLLLGGVLTEAVGWHWIFFVNVPVGLLAVFLTYRLLPRDGGAGLDDGIDVAGAALLVVSIMLAVYAIVGAGDHGWVTWQTLGTLAAALLLGVGFVTRQRMARVPLVPLRMLASRTVAGANIVSVLLLGGLFGMFFIGSLYLQLTLHYSPLQVGLALLPFAVAIGIVSLTIGHRLISRWGPRPPLVVGFTLAAAGMLLLRLADARADYASDLFPAFLTLGIGAGLAFPAVFAAAISTATPENSGLISGLINTTQQVGGALGLSVLAVVASNRATALRPSAGEAEAALGGYHLAFSVAACFLAAGALLSLTLLPSRAHQHA